MVPFVLQSPEHTSPAGYAEFGVNLLCALYRQGYPVAYDQCWWDPIAVPTPEHKTQILNDIRSRNLDVRAAVFLRLADQPQVDPRIYSILYTMFETDGLPNDWVPRMNYRFDEIWVPSIFNKRTFGRAGVRPEKIYRIPLGIDLDEIKGVNGKKFRARIIREVEMEAVKRPVIFLAMLQTQPRKNLEVLIQTYYKAFKDQEDVVLVLKTYGGGGTALCDWLRKVRKESNSPFPKILVNEQALAFRQATEFIAAADVYVSMSHGEGMDMTALKMASLGKPVVAPFWSGYTDYLKPNGILSIPIVGFSMAHNKGVVTDRYYRGQFWCDPDKKQAEKILLRVKDSITTMDPEIYKEVQEVQKTVRTNHDINHTAQRVADQLEVSLERPPTPMIKGRRGVFMSQEEDAKDNSSLRVVTACPSPSLPCGVWDSSLELVKQVPFGSRSAMARTESDTFAAIENGAADLVHLQFHYGFHHHRRLEAFFRKLKEYHVKIVTTHHSVSPGNMDNEVIMKYSDEVIVHNPELLESYKKMKGRVHFLPLHCGPPYEHDSRPSSLAAKRRVVGFFGFSFEHKCLKEWILGIELLKERIPEVYGLAVSPIHPQPNPFSVNPEPWLRKRKGSNFIHLIQQYLPEDQVLKTLSRCEVIVLPYRETRWKGSSAAVRFVMRLGIPIIATDTCWFRDLDKTIVAKMVPEMLSNPGYIATTIEAILNDKKGNAEQVEAIKEYREEHSTVNMARRTREIYDKAMGRKAKKELEVVNA